MSRLARWLKASADGSLALAIAVTVGLVGVLDALGADKVDAAILLTLALLAALRGRQLWAQASVDQSTAVRLDLPGSFTDRDITDIIRWAIQPKNPYW